MAISNVMYIIVAVTMLVLNSELLQGRFFGVLFYCLFVFVFSGKKNGMGK